MHSLDLLPTRKALRSFGLLVGTGFAVFGTWPWLLRAEACRAWPTGFGLMLIICAVLVPHWLTQPYRIWMSVGYVLGWFNTRLILGAIFYAVFTPLGFLLRLAGYDPLARRFDPSAETYRVRVRSRDSQHLKRPF